MSSSKPRGALILLEGLDKAGKSTQCTLLTSSLARLGHKVLHLRFPDRTTPIGKMIDSYLKGGSDVEDHVIHLLFSANRWEAVSKIKAALADGTTVIMDRYYASGIVFSAAKNDPSLSLTWCRASDIGLPLPDVALFLSLSPEQAAVRGAGYGEEKYEKKETQDRARRLFERLMGDEKRAGLEHWVEIDAGQSMDEVQKELVAQVIKVVAAANDGTVGELQTVKALD